MTAPEPTAADKAAWEIYGPAIFHCAMTGPEALARHAQQAREEERERNANDWFAGNVDVDGNELVTIRADELQKLRDERDKFMWQVRDTCTRAERAEAALSHSKKEARCPGT